MRTILFILIAIAWTATALLLGGTAVHIVIGLAMIAAADWAARPRWTAAHKRRINEYTNDELRKRGL